MARDGIGIQLRSMNPRHHAVWPDTGPLEVWDVHLPLEQYGCSHTFWWMRPDWFITDSHQSGSQARCAHGDTLFQVFTDGTYQEIVRRKSRAAGAYACASMSCLSRDATKAVYYSGMLIRNRGYIAAVVRPLPPVNPAVKMEDKGAHLIWSPSQYSRETAGYCVYRGRKSGGPYELLAQAPVKAKEYVDKTLQLGQYC